MPKTRSQKARGQEEGSSKVQPKPKKQPIKKTPLSRSQLRHRVVQKLIRQKNMNTQEGKEISTTQISTKIRELLPMQKLNCSICLETLIFPTLTQCGHYFCLPCAEEAIRYKSTCSFCRAPIEFDEFKTSKMMQNLLDGKINSSDEGIIENYKKRVENFKQSDEKCRICQDIKVGEMIDFWSERRWRQGKIIQTKILNNKKIHKIQSTPHWSSDRTQTSQIQASSRLLAKHRTFTKEEQVRPRGRLGQFRVQIMNIRDTDEPPLLFELMRNHRPSESRTIQIDQRMQNSIIRIALNINQRFSQ